MKNFARVVLLLGVLACSSRAASPPPPMGGTFSCSADGVKVEGTVRELHITHDAAQPLEIAITLSPTADTSAWSFVLEGTGSASNSTRGSHAGCDLRGSGLGRALSLRGSSNQPIMVSLITLDATVRSSATVKPGASGSLSFGH